MADRPTLGPVVSKQGPLTGSRLALFLAFLFAVTVARAIWWGMTLGVFLLAIGFYVVLWVAVVVIAHYLRRT